jgi:hypothetical protein
LDQIAIQVDGEFKQDAFYLSNTSLVPILAKPSPHHTFNYTTKQWQDPRTLQDFKDQQWSAIKQARSSAIDAPLVTPYGTFDSDAAGRTSITDAVLLANNLTAMSMPVAIEFTLSDNTSVTLNAEQMAHVGMLLGQKVQTAHPRSQTMRAQIETATTVAEVEAVVW